MSPSQHTAKVLICAGGTGGGIYPALTAAHALQQLGLPREHLLWVGVAGEMEERLIPREGIRLERIVGGAIAGVSRWEQLKNGLKLLRSVWLSSKIMGRFRPDVVLLTGGYMALPVAAAARLRRIPAVMYLPDLEPGSALSIISRYVQRIAATFQASERYFRPADQSKVVETGYPIRPALLEATKKSKEEALAHFGLCAEKPVLLVFGGSRGAWSINQALMEMLPTLLQENQIIHISGTLTWDKVEAHAKTLPQELRNHYRPFAYLHDEMGLAFRAADLVVARGGASMLGESPLFGLPSILVPYPYAWRYQKVNADYLVERGAAIRLDDEKLGSELQPLLVNLLADPEKRAQMQASAEQLHRPGAATRLAELILATAKKDSDRE